MLLRDREQTKGCRSCRPAAFFNDAPRKTLPETSGNPKTAFGLTSLGVAPRRALMATTPQTLAFRTEPQPSRSPFLARFQTGVFTMDLKTRIQQDMKAALKAHETVRLGAIRMLLAAARQKEVDMRIELDDAGVIAIIEKMVKQRQESLAQFEAAGREDLAAREREEIVTLNMYLPEKMSETEIIAAINCAMQETGAASATDMGKLMAILKPRLAGKADMALVSKLVKTRLA
jgi:uncharacterized protein YqeY